jgi:2-oxoglutarate ferredoxin oxidoreductase subunit alpha
MQAKWGTHGDHPVIALSPSSVLETYTLIIRAFNLSEKYRTPVIFLMDEIVGHMREGVELPNPSTLIINQRKPSFHDGANKQCYYVPEGEYVPAMKPFGRGERYNITGLAHDESGFPTNNTQVAGKLVSRLLSKVEEHVDDIVRLEEYAMDDAETAIVCFGGTTRAVMSAVLEARAAGKKVGMFRPITVWPFPEKQLKARIPQLKNILMVEHNHGQMLLEVQRVVNDGTPVSFLGKVDGTVITPAEILAKLQEMEV